MGLLAIPCRLTAKQTKKSGSKRSSHQVKSTFAISFQAVTNLHSLRFWIQIFAQHCNSSCNSDIQQGLIFTSVMVFFCKSLFVSVGPFALNFLQCWWERLFHDTTYIKQYSDIQKLVHLSHQQQTVYLVMCTRQLNRWSSLLPLGKNFMH